MTLSYTSSLVTRLARIAPSGSLTNRARKIDLYLSTNDNFRGLEPSRSIVKCVAKTD